MKDDQPEGQKVPHLSASVVSSIQWPDAVREYEKPTGLHTHQVGLLTRDCLWIEKALADAAIRDLKDGWKTCREKLHLSNAAWIAEKARREQAEAEVARLKRWRYDEAMLGYRCAVEGWSEGTMAAEQSDLAARYADEERRYAERKEEG